MARTIFSTLSGVKPNWVMMKPGVLFSFTTRCRLNAASLRGDAVAGIEFGVAPQLEGEDQAVLADVPLLGQVALDLGGIVQVRADQAAVAVGVDLAIGELIGFGGIEADDIVDLLGHDGDPFGRGGAGPAQDGWRRDRAPSGQQGASGQHCVCLPDLACRLLCQGCAPAR